MKTQPLFDVQHEHPPLLSFLSFFSFYFLHHIFTVILSSDYLNLINNLSQLIFSFFTRIDISQMCSCWQTSACCDWWISLPIFDSDDQLNGMIKCELCFFMCGCDVRRGHICPLDICSSSAMTPLLRRIMTWSVLQITTTQTATWALWHLVVESVSIPWTRQVRQRRAPPVSEDRVKTMRAGSVLFHEHLQPPTFFGS